MTKDDVRAAAKRLVDFHERFAPTFGKVQAQDNAFTYIKGLMICPERKSISVKEVGASLPAAAWRTLLVAQGTKGPLAFEFAAVRVWAVRHGAAGPPVWLLVRRSLEPVPEIKYYISNAPETTPLGSLASHMRTYGWHAGPT